MKIRKGFVSNSSSSSFVVAVKDGGSKIKLTVTYEIDLERYTRRILTPNDKLNEVIEWFEDDYGFHNKKMVKQVTDALQNGKNVYVGSFSNEDGPEEAFLCENGLKGAEISNGTLDIIYNEPGY